MNKEIDNPRIKLILNKSCKYCSRGEKSTFDIKRFLFKENLSDEELDFIIKNLIDNNFINEERYIAAFINDKIAFNKWGKNKIFYELMAKGIDEKKIKKLLNEIDIKLYEDNLHKIIIDKYKSINKNSDKNEIINKLKFFASSKGYDYDDINKEINKIFSK